MRTYINIFLRTESTKYLYIIYGPRNLCLALRNLLSNEGCAALMLRRIRIFVSSASNGNGNWRPEMFHVKKYLQTRWGNFASKKLR